MKPGDHIKIVIGEFGCYALFGKVIDVGINCIVVKIFHDIYEVPIDMCELI